MVCHFEAARYQILQSESAKKRLDFARSLVMIRSKEFRKANELPREEKFLWDSAMSGKIKALDW